MEITWYGQSCFRFTERSMLTVVTDPFESKKDALKLKADAVTISKDSPAHNNVNAVVGAQRGRPAPVGDSLGLVGLVSLRSDVTLTAFR